MGNWFDSEDLTRRRSEELPYGRAHSFVFTGIPVGARLANLPARGTNLATITKLGLTGMTGFGVRVASAVIVQNKGNSELHVTAIEPEPYTPGTNGPELKGSRREFSQGYMQTGEMLFASLKRTGAGIPVPHVTYFRNLDNQVEGGPFGRVCVEMSQEKQTIPGVVFTRATFKTAGWGDDRKAGVAKVSLRGLTTQDEMMFDANGKQLVGPCFDEGYLPTRFVITKGEVASLKKKAIIVIETAYARLNPAELLGYIDTVNNGALANLGLGSQTCRMLAPDATRWWKQGSLWYADYAMLYDPKAGHNDVWSVEQTKIPFKVPLSDESGAIIDPKEYKTVYDWWPCYLTLAGARTNTKPEKRQPYPLRNWSGLDGMIEW